MKKNVKRIVGASLVGAICFGLGTAVTLANNVKVEAATTDFQMKTGAAVRLASDSAGFLSQATARPSPNARPSWTRC